MEESRTYTERIYEEGADTLTSLRLFFERVESKMVEGDTVKFVKVFQDSKTETTPCQCPSVDTWGLGTHNPQTCTMEEVEVTWLQTVVKVVNTGEEVKNVRGE